MNITWLGAQDQNGTLWGWPEECVRVCMCVYVRACYNVKGEGGYWIVGKEMTAKLGMDS